MLSQYMRRVIDVDVGNLKSEHCSQFWWHLLSSFLSVQLSVNLFFIN